MSSESGKPAGKPVRKPGYTNPAFKALGIPTLRLPSRNWMIFWSVLTVSIGGIAYDKYRQRQTLNRATELVKPLAEETMEVDKIPRKITVFIAPPPNDYLESSLKIWRRYVKPVLYYAGLDYELVEEDRQGTIRTNVADRIRELRREMLALTDEQPLKEPSTGQEAAKPKGSLSSKISSLLPLGRSGSEGSVDDEAFDPEMGKKFKKNFDWRNVIGIFYTTPKPTDIISEDSLVKDPILSGGVICLGRGAYKEYMAGIHEGLLGPIEKPEEHQPTEPKITEVAEVEEIGSKADKSSLTALSDAKNDTDPEETTVQDDLKPDEEKTPEDSKVFKKPFITPEEYPDLQIAPELQTPDGGFIRNPNTNIPLLINQPLLVIPVPNLIGFTTIPTRICRFYQKRFYVENVCSSIVNCVRQTYIRPFDIAKDIDLAKDEEKDWPQNWVKQGKEKNSEWTQELICDPRVTNDMFIYEDPSNEEPGSSI
ncbi:Tim54p [Saccharomyces cerevisiae x Saccharomyces kudriavzevii VIN7]|uniref:Mitochondrial import inner membrane translocase subunit TIM54 n=1 Tax=Saccharomyces cerevisiae x Saccharomyces kudriavzevii (strain VIN7) TaxID=1095631 RepID=H0GWU2_SACCK|nr:Tim54p [Saccharomyces cerevisiae x Saccharomyces kudriavzevii VIN7]